MNEFKGSNMYRESEYQRQLSLVLNQYAPYRGLLSSITTASYGNSLLAFRWWWLALQAIR